MSNVISKQKRLKVARLKGWKCWYCGLQLNEESLNIDHLHPRKLGGGHEYENLVPSCRTCNTAKGVKSIDEYRMYESLKNSEYGITITTRQYVELSSRGLISKAPEMHEFYFETIGD